MSINGITEKIGVGLTMSRRWTDPPIQIMVALAGGIPALLVGEYLIATKVGLAYTVLPLIVLGIYYEFVFLATPKADTEKYLTFKVLAPHCAHTHREARCVLSAVVGVARSVAVSASLVAAPLHHHLAELSRERSPLSARHRTMRSRRSGASERSRCTSWWRSS